MSWEGLAKNGPLFLLGVQPSQVMYVSQYGSSYFNTADHSVFPLLPRSGSLLGRLCLMLWVINLDLSHSPFRGSITTQHQLKDTWQVETRQEARRCKSHKEPI
jgi:hypothetical protein